MLKYCRGTGGSADGCDMIWSGLNSAIYQTNHVLKYFGGSGAKPLRKNVHLPLLEHGHLSAIIDEMKEFKVFYNN